MSKPLKVLIVEDSEDDATLITRELNKGGFDSDVTRIQTAEGMKKALEKKKWDIILSDYRMPGFSGLHALEILKETGFDIPFILISGTVGETLAVEAMKAGACDYVMKDKLNRLDVAIERELRDAKIRHDKKRAEEALRESEQKYKFLIDKMHEMALILDKTGTIMFANRSSLETFGYSEDEVIGKSMAGFLTKGSIMKAFWAIAQEFLGNHHGEFEVEGKNKKGEIRTLLIAGSSNPIYKDGKMVGILVSASDITERKQAEEALRQSEEKFRRVVETALEGVWFLDSEFKTTEVNDAVVHMLGYAPEELIGRPFIDFVIDEERPMQVQEFQQRKRGISGQYERKVQCKNGSVKWLFLSAKAVMSAQGAFVGTFAMITDITERKLSEEALRQSEARFRILFEQAADIILQMEITPEGMPVIRDVNNATLRLLGYERDELIGQPVSFINVASEAPQAIHERRQNIISGPGQVFEAKHRCKDGTVRDFECSAAEIQVGPKTFAVSVERDITERKRVEEVLHQSEERYKALFDRSLNLVYIHNFEGQFTDANNMALNLLGYTKEEMCSLNFSSLLTEDQLPLAFKTLQEITENGAQKEATVYKLRKKNGGDIYIETIGSRILSMGKPVAILGIALDITERKRAGDALRESEEKFKRLFEESPSGIAMVDTEGVLLEVNRSLLKLLGISREEMVGKNFTMLAAGFGLNTRKQIADFGQRLTGGTPTNELTFLNRYGKQTTITVQSSNIISKGQATGVLYIVNDTTERKRAEETLRESEERFRAIFNNTGEGILVADMSTRKFLFGNHTISRMLGYTDGEIGKLSVNDIHKQKDLATVIDALEKLARREIEMATDLPVLRKDGSVFYADISSFPLSLAGKSYLVGIFHDITQRRTMEKEKEQLLSQLLQAQKMEAIGTLAGGVAHDFNNLLTAISGFTTMAMGKIDESDPIQRDLRQVSTAATKAAGLTRQLLLFSRKQHMEPVPLDPNATISRLLKMLDRLIGEDIVIEADLGNDIWHILGDEGNIEQVLMNLSVNARDAMPEGGKLFIKTENVTIDDEYCRAYNVGRSGNFVCISVSDTGTGMDQLTQDHIFEPFFTTKGEGKGTGLGLSVVLGIVQQHKGWINVYSEPGHGTTFRVYIPSSSARHDQKSKEETSFASLEGKGERIMVVEDQPEVRAIANQMLLTNGYSVFPVSSAKEAIELFEKENGRFDLVFSDVVLPDRSGVLLVQELLKRWKFKVIITSGYTDEKANWDFIKENNFRFMHKPYTVRDLLQAVREVLAEKKLEIGKE